MGIQGSKAIDLTSAASSGAPETHVTVIKPPSGWPGFGLHELWQLRSICLVLVRRTLMVRYRQTVVGAIWTLVQPIALVLLFSIFFGLLARMPSGGLPYAVFFFLGVWPFQMASKIFVEGTQSVVANSALVTRVYFPRVYFPTAVGLASLLDVAVGALAVVALLIMFSITPGPEIVLTPVFIAIGLLGSLGISYWLSAVNVAYRDIQQMLPFFAQMWMFASPIIYPSDIVPAPYDLLYYLNPMALVIDGLRWSIAGLAPPTAVAWILGTASSLVLLVSGYVFFRRREANFSDIV